MRSEESSPKRSKLSQSDHRETNDPPFPIPPFSASSDTSHTFRAVSHRPLPELPFHCQGGSRTWSRFPIASPTRRSRFISPVTSPKSPMSISSSSYTSSMSPRSIGSCPASPGSSCSIDYPDSDDEWDDSEASDTDLLASVSSSYHRHDSRSDDPHPTNPTSLAMALSAALASNREPSLGGLHCIPCELLVNSFSFLDTVDLCSLCSVCRQMASFAEDWYLWSDLYVRRWAVFQPQIESEWKLKYKLRDDLEMATMMNDMDSSMRVYVRQMLNSQRKRRERNEFEIIRNWKQTHSCEEDLHQSCSRRKCTFFQDEEIFICEKTGNVHFCSFSCCKRKCLAATGELLCSVTGNVFSSGTESTERFVVEPAEIGEEPPLAFFANYYEMGYNCPDYEQMYENVVDFSASLEQ